MALSGLEMVKAVQAGRPLGPAAPWVEHMRLADEYLIETVEPGRIGGVWTPGAHWTAPDGYVIGGTIGAVADIALGLAVFSTEPEVLDAWWTLDLNTRFVRPIRAGDRVRIDSCVIAKTKNSAIAEATFTLAEDRLAAKVAAGFRPAGQRRSMDQTGARSR